MNISKNIYTIVSQSGQYCLLGVIYLKDPVGDTSLEYNWEKLSICILFKKLIFEDGEITK